MSVRLQHVPLRKLSQYDPMLGLSQKDAIILHLGDRSIGWAIAYSQPGCFQVGKS